MSPPDPCATLSASMLLRQQFRLAHRLLDAATAAISTEMIHRCPPGAAAPAGARYAQIVVCEDLSVNGALATGVPLALSSWAGRTGLSELPPLARPGPADDWYAWARRVRIELAALRAYAQAVYAATDVYLAALPDDALDPACHELPVCLLNALLLTLAMRRGEIACLLAAEQRILARS